MKVLVNSTPIALWHDIIHEAEKECSTPLSHELEAYVVLLMVRYTNKPELAEQIMATQYLEGLSLPNKQREFQLQGVGDSCLLLSGLFPGIAKKRLVKISYFINIGRGAYVAVSKTSNDLYSLLAQEFVAIMDILQSISRFACNFPELMPLEAYDLWNESGSQRALKVLHQYSQANRSSILINTDPCIIKLK
jgi:hypothetical protein